MKNLNDWRDRKRSQSKISVITCYDWSMARWVQKSPIDAILVGDSVAMVVHGFPHTYHATPDMMIAHTAAVARGAPEKWIIGDMPFLSFRKGPGFALDVASELLKAGAHSVKVEGVEGHEDVIRHLIGSGIPVMGHLGLTPQSVQTLGGYRVQGKSQSEGERILDEARKLEDLGVFSLVLECIPSALGLRISQSIGIPTIGIGAGPGTDGQVLVFHDALGLSPGPLPRFVRQFKSLGPEVVEGMIQFHEDVQRGQFPAREQSYGH